MQNFHRILKFGVAVAVDHGVDLGMLLAVGAFVRREILIIRNILQREQGVDRNSVAFFHGAEQGADSSELPVVILDAFHSPADGLSGSYRRNHQEHPLVPNNRLDVIPENHLVVGIGFRSDNSEVGVVIDCGDAGLGKLLRQLSADDAGAFQTDNHVYRCGGISFRQFLSRKLGFFIVRFDIRHINVIVYMGMAGGKMARNNFNPDSFVFLGAQINCSGVQTITPF